jgi:hypothetical protein
MDGADPYRIIVHKKGNLDERMLTSQFSIRTTRIAYSLSIGTEQLRWFKENEDEFHDQNFAWRGSCCCSFGECNRSRPSA